MAEENKGEIVLYQSNDGTIKVDVRLEEETVWLSQTQMGFLFGKSRTTDRKSTRLNSSH